MLVVVVASASNCFLLLCATRNTSNFFETSARCLCRFVRDLLQDVCQLVQKMFFVCIHNNLACFLLFCFLSGSIFEIFEFSDNPTILYTHFPIFWSFSTVFPDGGSIRCHFYYRPKYEIALPHGTEQYHINQLYTTVVNYEYV